MKRWHRNRLSAAEFPQSLGVIAHTLYAWAGQARRDGPKLVELITAPSDVRSLQGKGDREIEITLRNGRVLRAPPSMDDDRLGRLITLTESA